jgi:hypothetical protein
LDLGYGGEQKSERVCIELGEIRTMYAQSRNTAATVGDKVKDVFHPIVEVMVKTKKKSMDISTTKIRQNLKSTKPRHQVKQIKKSSTTKHNNVMKEEPGKTKRAQKTYTQEWNLIDSEWNDAISFSTFLAS